MNIQLIFHRGENRNDRKGMEFFPIAGALLVIQVVSLATKSYFAGEALVFVAIAALLVFVGANLVFLGILLQEAVRGVLRYAKKLQPINPPQLGVFRGPWQGDRISHIVQHRGFRPACRGTKRFGW